MEKVRISGIGCCLLDSIYTDADFNSKEVSKRFSLTPGDGGILPGQLVFSEDLERFTGEKIETILKSIIPESKLAKENIGGPCIVALILASQLIHPDDVDISYFGTRADDSSGETLGKLLAKTDVLLDNYIIKTGATPQTIVLSDPSYNKGAGERAFLNTLGVAAEYMPQEVPPEFFNVDLLLFGGTALVPSIHDNLHELLEKGKQNSCINIVSTVFDFRNENRNAAERWPLGNEDDSFRLMDLLIMDKMEALRISASKTLEQAANFFINKGTGSFIITQGTEDVIVFSRGEIFKEQALRYLPILPSTNYDVVDMVSDTTGCGDNFAGGVLSSVIMQIMNSDRSKFDLIEACILGIVSGTYTSLITGGVDFERHKGDKLRKISALKQDYLEHFF
jgi:sugar/nucleoside kinase (ribokinase family)